MHPETVLFGAAPAEGEKDPISHMGGRGQVIGGQRTKPPAAGCVTLFIRMRLMLHQCNMEYTEKDGHIQIAH